MTQLQTPEVLGQNPERAPEVLRGEVVERLAAVCLERLEQEPWELSDINPMSSRDISLFPTSLDAYNRLERSYAVPRYYASIDPLWVKQFKINGREGDFMVIGARYNLMVHGHPNEQAVIAYDLDLTEGSLRPIGGAWPHYEQFARNLAKGRATMPPEGQPVGLADQAELMIREFSEGFDNSRVLTASEKTRVKYGREIHGLVKRLIADPTLYDLFEKAPATTTTMLRLRDLTGQAPHNAVGMSLWRTGVKFERIGLSDEGEPQKTVIYIDTENGFGSLVVRTNGVAANPPERDAAAGRALVQELTRLTDGLRRGYYAPYDPNDPAPFEFPQLLENPGSNRFKARVPVQSASHNDENRQYLQGGRYIIVREVL